jgi:hypothetical protein
MATFTWTGAAGDGDFSTAGNWLGGVAPAADAQDYVFDRGSADLTAGLATGFSAANITITPGYAGKIGSESAALTFTNVTGTIRYAGSGQWCKIGCSGTVAALQTSHSGGTFHASGGTWTLITTAIGAVRVEASAVVTTLRNVNALDVKVAASSTAITTLTNYGHTEITDRDVTTANNGAGRTRLKGTCDTTKINLYGGEVNDQSDGTATHVEAFPGARYTMSGLTANKTITSRTRWAGATIDTTAPGVTVTLTNAETVVGEPGGSVPGQQL